MSFKNLSQFIKLSIVFLVLLTSSCGYLLSYDASTASSWLHFVIFAMGVSLLSAGSLSLNEVQEWEIDALMRRTSGRPIPSGNLDPKTGKRISWGLLALGSVALYWVSPVSMLIGWTSVILYNGFYTLYWKRTSPFAAVPGAIPGALPYVMGYAANSAHLTAPECWLGFLVMFFWQMPHFWVLAIKYLEDYRRAGIPVLPTVKGVSFTLEQIRAYLFLYLATACVWLLMTTNPIFAAIFLAVFTLKMIVEFSEYLRTPTRWLGFFMWTNVSILIFLALPVFNKWSILGF